MGFEGRTYRRNGAVIDVSALLGGGTYGTCRVTARGGMRRVKSPYLPVREDPREAQADLDGWAAKHGLPECTA